MDSDISDESGEISDKYARNFELEERSQSKDVYKSDGSKAGTVPVIKKDYTSKAFRLKW